MTHRFTTPAEQEIWIFSHLFRWLFFEETAAV
ncbi:hypothetical protein P353_04880 [Comamonas testosteroni]|uniref:Uncharacterized protein n=1 Tax=Comamonas testosteroni TaxID=285 RepID=A0A096H2F3_COMTE|nr:hypothetical protein P353_04880 [Comamonas testosteroni]